MQLPQHVANYSIFRDGKRLIGLADVTLPDLKNLTDALKGSGIFGEIDAPIQAHFQPGAVTLNWLSITDDAIFATLQDGAQLDAWSSVQFQDTSTGKIIHKGWRFIMTTLPKSFNFGKLEIGTKGEAVSEFELVAIRAIRDDVTVCIIDKVNAICQWWDGVQLVDFAQVIRQQIGLT